MSGKRSNGSVRGRSRWSAVRWLALAHQILEGTNEIMRVIIARRLLMEGATEVIQ